MNFRRTIAALVLSSLAVTGAVTSASSDQLDPIVIDSTETKSGGPTLLTVDRNNVIWANSRWNPDLRTVKLERYRVAANGQLSSLRDVRIRGLNPLNMSSGHDGKLFISDTARNRVAVVTLSRSSTAKKLRYVTFYDDVTIFDMGSDASGKIYVLANDGVYVLSRRAKNDRSPILRIDAPFQSDDKSLAVTEDGTFFVADEGAGAIYVFEPGDEEPIRTIRIDSSFAESGPLDITIGPDGLLYVTYSQAGIASFNLNANGSNLTPVSWITTSIDADVLDPLSIAIDSNDHMIISDYQGTDGIKVLGLPVR
jgi:sugar lactone lactonase YvrE